MLVLLISISMAIPALWSLYEFWYQPSAWRVGTEVIMAFVYSMATGTGLGLIFCLIGIRSKGTLGKREALLIVFMAWFLGTALAALPFWYWANLHELLPKQDQAFLSYINCYFEAMSGLTTTGATVLTNIESIPYGLLFWRAATHWLGGLGIIVLFVAVLPSFGGGTKYLFRTEASGIHDGVSPQMHETAQAVLYIYFGFTIAEILALKIAAPNITWFDSITHTFATLATGGFSSMNSSVGAFPPIVHWIVIFFMVLAGVNFALYQQLFRGRFRRVFQNNEFRLYLTIMFVAFAIIAYCIAGTSYHTTTGALSGKVTGDVIREAAFQVASIQTTTGFVSVNFEEWGLLPKAILIALMFIGGCGGSTGGGIKVIRILAAAKVMWLEIERSFRPSVLRPVRIGTHIVDFHQRISVLAYVLGIVCLFGIGTVLLMITEDPKLLDGTTALTASVACVNNIGPGLSRVGAIENYAWFTDIGKIILCFLMAIGRLEIFAVMVFFMPRFWRTQ